MTVAPSLRERDIQSQVHVLSKRYLDRPILLLGTGDSGTVRVDERDWTVVATRSELDIRRALSTAAASPRLVLLVDHTDQLPLDLACRVAGRRIHMVERGARLANLFGARRAAPAMLGSALAPILLDEMPEGLRPVLGTVIQPVDGWDRYLSLRLQVPLGTVYDCARLSAAALDRPDAGPAFRARRDLADWAGALKELDGLLVRHGGSHTRQVFESWLHGDVEELFGWVLLIDAARRSGSTDALRSLRMGLGYRPRLGPKLVEDPLAGDLCAALGELLPAMEPSARRRLFARARALMPAEGFEDALAASPWIPAARSVLLDRLSRALRAALDDRSHVKVCVALLDQLQSHQSEEDTPAARHARQVRTLAVRLACWVIWPDTAELSRLVGLDATVETACWYSDEGGWVDFARHELRAQSTGHTGLDRCIREEVLPRADRKRATLDRTFAHGLGSWYQHHQPSKKVLPIHDVLATVAAGFLEGHAGRRLLVVVLDGMSMAVADQLMHHLEGWQPVAWTPGRRRSMPPALATLPTLTSTSRADLFAGMHKVAHGNEKESRDPKRFAAHRKLQGYGHNGGAPQLFGKAVLGEGATLHRAVAEAIADTETRLVATIVNAVDAQLDGSDQVHVRYGGPQSIPLLDALLRAAEAAGRAVLLTSDHGHIPATVLTGQTRPEHSGGDGARWRTLSPGQAHSEDEILLPDGCWAPDSRRVALLWNESVCWGRSHKGVHGGASLAEVVIPVRLLAPAWFAEAPEHKDDPGLATTSLDVPRWWRMETPPAPRQRARPSTGQLSLLPTRPPSASEASTEKSLVEALRNSSTFQAMARGVDPKQVKRALRLVDVLFAAKGHALSHQMFADRAGLKLRRVSGVLSRDVAFLNADGIAIIEDDVASDQVRLNVQKLRAQYHLEKVDG